MGFVTSGSAWLNTVNVILKDHADEFQICIFDNRGCCRSSCPDAKFSTSVLAKDALDLLNHLKWEQVHVVGISMGGMIAQELSFLLFPTKRLLSLSLAVTHAGGIYATAPFAGLLAVVSSLLKKTPEEKADTVMKMIYSPKFLASPCKYDPSKTWFEHCKQDYISMHKELPETTPKGAAGHIRCVSTHSVGSKRLHMLRDSQVPIVIMTGTDDSLVRPKNSHILAKELHPVEFHVWEGAGHAVNVECMDAFTEVIIRNFRRGAEQALQRGGTPSPAKEEASGEEKYLDNEQQPETSETPSTTPPQPPSPAEKSEPAEQTEGLDGQEERE